MRATGLRPSPALLPGLLLAALACAPTAGAGDGEAPGGKEPPPPLRLVATIPLPGVRGRIDHLAHDAEGKRLFVAALGNDTVEVVDLAALSSANARSAT